MLPARSGSPSRCTPFRFSCRPQNRHDAACAGAAEILRQSDLVPRNLARAGLAADLQRQVAELRHAGRADGMAFRLETAAGVDRPRPRAQRAALEGVRPALPAPAETQVFAGDDLRDREAVLQL